MINIDADGFARLLDETAECFAQKPLSAGAQRRWFEILKDSPFPRVQAAFRLYLGSRKRMPVPNDILDICASLNTPRTDLADPGASSSIAPRTVYGAEAIRALREFLAMPPKPPSKTWAGNILAAHDLNMPLRYRHPITRDLLPISDAPISDFQVRFAHAALQTKRLPERVPGEDDE